MSKFRWGIFGTGFVAKKFALGLRLLPDSEIAAIGSRSVNRAQSFADGLGCNALTGSYEEIAEMSNLDAIYIATPPAFHLTHALLCIHSGKPVLVEKPLACSANEAMKIKEASEANNIFCMEAMWSRFLPLIKQVKGMINDGSLGDIRLMSGSFCKAEQPSKNNNLFSAQMGGGALLDRAVYPISLAIYFMGKPVNYSGHIVVGLSNVDEQVAITLQFGPECIAQFQASLIVNANNNFLISGSKAMVNILPPIYRPFRMSVSPVRTFPREDAKAPSFKDTLIESHWLHQAYQRLNPMLIRLIGKSTKTVCYAGNGYHYQAEEVISCVRAGKQESNVMPLDESIAVLEIVDRLRSDLNLDKRQTSLN